MKTVKISIICCIVLFLSMATTTFAQTTSAKEARIQNLLESKNFTFVAESANPMSGGSIRLNSSNYQVSFYKDSLESFLPYFGTAYRAPYGATQSPLMFSSGDFVYNSEVTRKGGHTVTIKINTPSDPDVLILSVSASGYGTLQVSSIDRQPISFYGSIKPNEKEAN